MSPTESRREGIAITAALLLQTAGAQPSDERIAHAVDAALRLAAEVERRVPLPRPFSTGPK